MTRTVTHSHYTREGVLRHQVYDGAMVAGAETDDGEFAAEHARALYHNLRPPKRLLDYDGDTGTERVLEERSS